MGLPGLFEGEAENSKNRRFETFESERDPERWGYPDSNRGLQLPKLEGWPSYPIAPYRQAITLRLKKSASATFLTEPENRS